MHYGNIPTTEMSHSKPHVDVTSMKCKELTTYKVQEDMASLVPGDKRRAKKKKVAILADSLPLNASRHNTMHNGFSY